MHTDHLTPNSDDYEHMAQYFALNLHRGGWCQLCGQQILASDVAWELPPKRRGSSRRPVVCAICFWQAGVPTADTVHLKIRFRVTHGKPASLSWAELKTAIDALDAVQAGREDPELEQLLSALDKRLASDKTNMTNAEAARLADALFGLESVRIPDPRAIASPLWELRVPAFRVNEAVLAARRAAVVIPGKWPEFGKCEHGLEHFSAPHTCDWGDHDGECPYWACQDPDNSNHEKEC